MRFLALALLAASASATLAQPLTAFPSPTGEPDQMCTEHEATLQTTRVCRSEQNGEATLVVAFGGRETARWDVASGVQAGPFAVFLSDLDRDGGRDLLVATQTAVSNGLGVAYWTLDVLADGDRQPTFSFQVEDFDADGKNFGHDGDRLVLWATDWIESDDPSGRRPSGMYFTGRPFSLSSRGLSPAASLPIRARRLLNSFDRSASGGPVGHLSDRRAESRRTDPALGGCRQRSETVTARSVHEATNEWGSRYLVLDIGQEREITYGKGGYRAEDEDVTHLGDRASGRLFPAEYRPAGLAETLTSREVRLTTCSDGDWVKARILWM